MTRGRRDRIINRLYMNVLGSDEMIAQFNREITRESEKTGVRRDVLPQIPIGDMGEYTFDHLFSWHDSNDGFSFWLLVSEEWESSPQMRRAVSLIGEGLEEYVLLQSGGRLYSYNNVLEEYSP